MDRISAVAVISLATSAIGIVVALSLRSRVEGLADLAIVAFFALAVAALVGWFHARSRAASTATVEAIVSGMRNRSPSAPSRARGLDRDR
jgi:hypothetical protein